MYVVLFLSLLPLLNPSMTLDKDAESDMVMGAEKELAYLDWFGSSRAPHQHLHREHYGYKKRSPSDHAENLYRYLHLATSLVPKDNALNAFCIRHPDLDDSNVKVSKYCCGLRICSVLD
jgi:hypothetical protein